MRLPFGGLFAAAAAGITCAAWTPLGSGWFLFLAAAALGVWGVHRRSAWILLAVAAGFGAVQVWQTRESPSFALGKIVEDGRLLATATGVVASEPLAFGEARMRFTLEASRIESDGQGRGGAAKILVIVKGAAPGRGDTIRATGPLEIVPPPRNPGQFNARRWMLLEGIACQMSVAGAADFEILAKARGFSLPRIAEHCRRWMEATLREGIADDPVICDLIAGMVLGVLSSMPDSLRQDFRNTGTFHLFSVSGLHVAMIGVILWQVLKLAGASRRSAVILIIPALFFYALITGWKPSSVRAATMAAIFLIGMTASRQPVAFNSLCAAGFVILARWTNELFNPGFQLSFLVVAAIILLAVPLRDLIRRNFYPDPFVPVPLWTRGQKFGATASEYLGGSVAVSLAAWVGSLPLTLAYFHIVSLSALPANILVVPLAFLIMATAALALAGGLAWSLLASIFNNANWLFCHLLLVIVQAAASLPGSYFYLGIPERAATVVTIFDFGSGGAAAIESGGKLWLVDCGAAWHLNGVLAPWLHSRGRTTPDGLILTHGDSRHIGAALELIRKNPPGIIVDSMLADRSPQRAGLHRDLAASGIPKSLCRAGDRITLAPGATLHALHPPTGLVRDEADDKVLVLRLDAGDTRILFLSDAGLPTQQWLLDHRRADLAADILVKGHPRSGLPMDPEFLAAVNPALVVSAAAFPENEPPDESWTSSPTARGIRLFGQDRTGAVRISLSPGRYEAVGFLNKERFSQLHRHKAQGIAEPPPP